MSLRAETVGKINTFLKTAQKEGDKLGEEISLDDLPPMDDEEADEDEEELDVAPPPAPAPDSDLGEMDEKLTHIEDTLEVMVDVMEDQKEFFEKEVFDNDTSDFEEYTDEQKEEEDDDDVTSDEFGLDVESDDNNSSPKEGRMPSLRAARNARLRKGKLASKKTASEGTTLKDEWELDKQTKKKFGPKNPEVPKGKVAPADVPELYKAADLTLELSDDNSRWTVCGASEKPLFVIELQGNEKMATEEFGKRLLLEMNKSGVIKTLKKYKAKRYVSKKKDDEKKEGKEDKEGCDFLDSKKAAADVKRRFARAMRLAISAMSKNLIKPIPLKVAMFDVLSDLNIPDAQRVVEYIWSKGATAQFETAIAKAEEFMGMSDEAFIEFESQIQASGVADVVVEEPMALSAARLENEHQQEIRKRASEGSLPFVTASETDAGNSNERLASCMPRPAIHRAKFGA